MQEALLYYAPCDVPRNRWFIAQLIASAAEHGVTLHLRQSAEAGREIRPAFVLNRSRCAEISRMWAAQGVPVFNHADVTEITNDKWRTYTVLHGKHGLPMAQTWRMEAGDALPADAAFPLVKKPLDGHGGAGVEWLSDHAAWMRIQSGISAPYLLQAPMIPAWDVRIYVLCGQIYAAMLRTSAQDFRSNFSLGGTVAPIEPDAQMRALVAAVQAVLPLHFAGVDLLRHPAGGYVLGEIEDAVGCRMLYQQTQLNPAADLISAAVTAAERA